MMLTFVRWFKANEEYALATLSCKDAGADWLVLCDTNGGSLTSEINKIVKIVGEKVGGKIGIHCHNDIGNSCWQFLEL